MSTEIAVLRALLFFSRRRAPATLADLLQRVGGEATEIQRALGSLARSELVTRTRSRDGEIETARLSLAGLAVACAAAANARRRAKTVSRPARVLPMVRRRRHAA